MRRISNQNVFYVLQGVLIGVIAAAVPVYAVFSAEPNYAVAISNSQFSPDALTVPVNASVIWTNQDDFGHTVTAVDSSWGSLTLTQGITYTQTFTQTGVFNYLCLIHSSMTGTITVTEFTE